LAIESSKLPTGDASPPRDERTFFKVIGPALAGKPFRFLCGGRE